jgi:hypothetical protein
METFALYNPATLMGSFDEASPQQAYQDLAKCPFARPEGNKVLAKRADIVEFNRHPAVRANDGVHLQLDGQLTDDLYCRAEHEVGDRWIVMAIRYDDDYRRVDGEWLFERRREHHWYAADVTERPQAVDFDSWGTSGRRPALPGLDASWSDFWSGAETGGVSGSPVASPRAGG